MATAGECDGRAPYESRGDGEKSRKKRLRPEIEDPHNVSQEAEQNTIERVVGPHTIRPGFSILVVKEWLQAEIYSMRKGCWKFITQRIPSHVAMIFEHNYVCVDGHDGHLHWSGYIVEEGEPQSRTIVVFDLGSETLFEMPLPDAILEDNRMNHLGFLSGKLCVRSYRWFEDEGIDVWVMEEYGVAESWVKRHSFCFSHFNGCPLNGFTSHSQFIYRNTDGHLVLYDPVADKTRILEKHCRGKYRPKRIVEYIDSLVWQDIISSSILL
ncbi:hypothetical protein Lser_V15G33451 [Lactuca serriola]